MKKLFANILNSKFGPTLILAAVFASACEIKTTDPAPASKTPPGNPPGDSGSTRAGTGFYVKGNSIYDANDNKFVIRGFNNRHTVNTGEAPSMIANNILAIKDLAATGANTVRVMLESVPDPNTTGQSVADSQAIVEKYIAQGLVPMVVDHYGTHHPDVDSLRLVVQGWIRNTAWLKKYERYVILNITNEWGHSYYPHLTSTVADPQWRDGNIEAIQALRAAGINNLIVVDAGGSGGDILTIQNYAPAVLDADPQHNVAFSIHLYSTASTPDVSTALKKSTFDIRTALTAATASGKIALIVGEFSTDIIAPGHTAPYVNYKTHTAMQTFQDLGVGWMAWVWSSNSDPIMDIVQDNMSGSMVNYSYQYRSDADLSAFGNLIVNDPVLGLKKTSTKASIFTNE